MGSPQEGDVEIIGGKEADKGVRKEDLEGEVENEGVVLREDGKRAKRGATGGDADVRTEDNH